MDVTRDIDEFFQWAANQRIEIYNEFALQFELSFYLRSKFDSEYKVQLERNVSFINLPKSKLVKKEIDIIVFRNPDDLNNIAVIELKAIINQKIARPINIYHWIEDLKFLEQLKSVGIGQCLSIFVTDNQGLLNPQSQSRSRTSLSLLPDFRDRRVQGTYSTHTIQSDKSKSVTLESEYSYEWKDYLSGQKYFTIAV